MAEKQKTYKLKFPPVIIEDAYQIFCDCLGEKFKCLGRHWKVTYRGEAWKLDTKNEFYTEYGKQVSDAQLHYTHFHDTPISL